MFCDLIFSKYIVLKAYYIVNLIINSVIKTHIDFCA